MKTETIPEAPPVSVEYRTASTLALAEVIELQPSIGAVPLMGSGEPSSVIATQISVWRQTLDQELEQAIRSGDEARQRTLRQCAVLTLQIKHTLPMLAEARAREAEAEQRKRDAEQARQDAIVAEMQELQRLRAIAFGIDS